MHTEQVYKWLADKPVKPEHRARVAALIATYTMSEGYGPDSAYDYWLTKRADFFTSNATPLVVDSRQESAGGSESGGDAPR